MPIELDNYDISILKSLLKDGRKSFRQISRETGITTPTVKARYERLMNVGFIKKIIPLIDFGKVEKVNRTFELQTENNSKNQLKSLKKGMQIKLNCDFCHGVIAVFRRYSNLQTMSDSFVALLANHTINKVRWQNSSNNRKNVSNWRNKDSISCWAI